MLSERYYIPKDFENYCKYEFIIIITNMDLIEIYIINEKIHDLSDSSTSPFFEDFLLTLANYFHWFFEEIDSRTMNNPMCM